jgi:hypothetical protein
VDKVDGVVEIFIVSVTAVIPLDIKPFVNVVSPVTVPPVKFVPVDPVKEIVKLPFEPDTLIF